MSAHWSTVGLLVSQHRVLYFPTLDIHASARLMLTFWGRNWRDTDQADDRKYLNRRCSIFVTDDVLPSRVKLAGRSLRDRQCEIARTGVGKAILDETAKWGNGACTQPRTWSSPVDRPIPPRMTIDMGTRPLNFSWSREAACSAYSMFRGALTPEQDQGVREGDAWLPPPPNMVGCMIIRVIVSSTL